MLKEAVYWYERALLRQSTRRLAKVGSRAACFRLRKHAASQRIGGAGWPQGGKFEVWYAFWKSSVWLEGPLLWQKSGAASDPITFHLATALAPDRAAFQSKGLCAGSHASRAAFRSHSSRFDDRYAVANGDGYSHARHHCDALADTDEYTRRRARRRRRPPPQTRQRLRPPRRIRRRQPKPSRRRPHRERLGMAAVVVAVVVAAVVGAALAAGR